MKRYAFTLIELLVVIIIVVALYSALFEGGSLLVLLFGWIPRTIWLAYRMVISAPLTVLAVIATFFVITVLLHFSVHYFREKWSFRQSFAVTGLIVALLTALVGISSAFDLGNEVIHPKQPLRKGSDFHRGLRRSGEWLEKQVGRMDKFVADHESYLPMGGTLLEDGRPGHGWMTQLLPYMEKQELYAKIDLAKPWDDPVNATVYKNEKVNSIRSGKSRYDFRDGQWRRPLNYYENQEGYQLTDYAANERVMWLGGSLRFDDISDGLSHTILIGEASDNLKPWGSPFNSRDPALGINRSPFGFGYAFPSEKVNFAMADGSVKSFTEKMSPEILRALATPNGNEPITEKELK